MTFRRTKLFRDLLLAAGVIASLLAASDSRAGMINVAPGSILRPPAGTTAGGALVPPQDLVTDQYKNYGVLFGAPGWTVGAAMIDLGNGTQVWAPVSPGFNGPFVNFGNSIVGSLVLPGSLIPAATNSLQVEFSNAQPHTALLTAFGGDWRYLGQARNDAGTGPHEGTLATLAVPRTHYFMIEGANVPPLEAPVPIPPLPRWGVEQISFGPLTADAPEPNGLAQSALGTIWLLACFALVRIRLRCPSPQGAALDRRICSGCLAGGRLRGWRPGSKARGTSPCGQSGIPSTLLRRGPSTNPARGAVRPNAITVSNHKGERGALDI